MGKDKMLTHEQRKLIWTLCRKHLGWSPDEVHLFIGKESVNHLSREEAVKAIERLKQLVGEQERNWYKGCEERFFLPENVRSFDPMTSAQIRMIIFHAGIVFEHNLNRFTGFLLKRFRINRITTNKKARDIIEALISMSKRRKPHAKAVNRE